MDYHSLKRRELQALCKEHNIPANSANSVLADKLSALLNEKQKPKARQRTCIKSSAETTDEGEPVESKRQAKKVRFSPNNDLLEYEPRSAEKQKDMVTQVKTRRKSVAQKADKPVVDSNAVEIVKDTAQIPVKVTRSRVQSLVKDVDKETEGNVGKVMRSRAHSLQKGGGVQRDNKQSKKLVKEADEATESVEEIVVGRARVTRSKAQTSVEGGTGRDASPHVKKKTGKQVKTDGRSLEPSKEVIDVPLRATRSRRQPLKEEIGETVTDLQADKKRTRREMKEVDKQEPPKKKSLRTKEVDEDKGAKMEAVNASRVTRNSKNKAAKVEVQELEEPIKLAGKKNVSRRKSVLPPEKTEVDPHLEEVVSQPARRNTRRKSVIQKAIKVESPAVGKKDSKRLSGIIEDKENVTTGSPKSKKRRGTPVIEDQNIETEYKSPKSSTRSTSKSEKNFVAKKEVESSLKNASVKGKSSAIRSSAPIKESSSKKRAKLSGTKQRDLEDHAVYSSKEGTPVAKLSFKLDEEVTEPVVTPAVDKSDGRLTRSTIKSERKFTRSTIKSEKKEPSQSARFTRSAIKSEREGPSQSAIEEQPIEAQLFSPEVAKFKHDPAVNTAPGRVTRRGIKHDGNAAGSFSEMVGKKKQTRQSAHKKPHDEDAEVEPDVTIEIQAEFGQPLDEVQKSSPEDTEVGPHPGVDTLGVQSEIKQPYDNVQMCSPEVAEVRPNPEGDTVGVGSESFKEVTGQILTVPDAVSDVSRVQHQNEEVYVESGIFCEAENLEKLVQENPSLGNDVYVECDDAISDRKSPLDMLGTPLIGKSGVQDDGSSLAMELETGSEPSTANKTLDVPVSGIDIDIEHVVEDNSDVQKVESLDVPVSGIDIDIERIVEDNNDVQNVESEHDQLTSNDDHATDKEDVRGDDSEPAQIENMHVAGEDIVRSHDQGPEQSLNVAVDDVPCDTIGQSDSLTSEDAPKTLATSGIDDVVVRVDAPAESAVDINKDVVGDIYDMDAEGDSGNEQKLTEGDEGVQPNESGDIFNDMSDEQTKDDDSNDVLDDQEHATAIDEDSDSGKFMEDDSHIAVKEAESELLGNIKAHDDPAREEASPILNTGEPTVDGTDSSQLVEDIGTHESLITKESSPMTYTNKESPFDSADSDLPTIKEDDRNKQEETQNQGTSVDWGDYDFETDEFEKPVSANGSADEEAKGKIDDQDSDLQRSARSSYTVEESFGLAAGFSNSVTKLEKDSRNAADGKSNEGVDMLKESANAVDTGEEVFNWPGADSSMKALFATPAATRISHVRYSQEDAAKFTNQDNDSSLKSSSATPATSRTSHVKSGQEEAVDLPNQDHYSSLKPLFKTPAVTQHSHAKDGQDVKAGLEDAVDFANQGHHSSLKPSVKTPAVTHSSDVKDGQEDAADFANQDHYSSLKSFFKTLADTQISHVKDGQEDAADFANQDPHSSLKSLYKTPAVTQISHAKDGQGDAVDFANQDHYSAMKSMFKTPAVTQTSHLKDVQEDAADFSNQDHYSSMKSLFKTPAVTQISHAKDGQVDTADFANQDHYSSLKSMFKTPAVTQINHAKDGQQDAFNFANQDHYSSLKSLFKTPAVSQVGHVKGGQEDAVSYANQDPYSSLKPLFKTPGVTQTGHAHGGQEDAVSYANQDPYTSLKPLFTTPATAQISHVKDAQGEATNFANKDHYSSLKTLFATPATSRTSHVNDCNENIGSSGTAAHEFTHQWGNDPSKDYHGETQGNAVSGLGNEIHGVPRFEDYPHKFFEDDVGGSIDRSESNTHFGYKQFEFLDEAARTSHQNLSGLKDNSTGGHEFEKKEDNIMKGSEVNDDVAFDTGHMHDYRGNTPYSNK